MPEELFYFYFGLKFIVYNYGKGTSISKGIMTSFGINAITYRYRCSFVSCTLYSQAT